MTQTTNRHSRRYLFSIIAASGLFLAACGSTSNATAKATTSARSPYTLHAILSLTGGAASLGQEEKTSLEGLQAYVNGTGGIDGHPLKIAYADNQTSASEAVSLASPLVGHVPAFLVGSVQTTDEPVDELDSGGSSVIYDLSPGDQAKAHSFIFSAGPSTSDEAVATVNYLEAKGWTRIAVINSTDASGADGWVSMQDAIRSAGNKITAVSHQSFDPTSVSVTTQMSKIRAANPQAIVVWTTGAPVVTVFKAMQQANMENTPTLPTWGNADPGLLHHVGSALPTNLLFVGPVFLGGTQGLSAAQSSAVAGFRNSLSKTQGVSVAAAGNGLGWDPGFILVSALRKYGPDATARQIHGYIENLSKFAGAMGTYNFTDDQGAVANRGLGVDSFVTVKWQPAQGDFLKVSGLGGKNPS